MTTLYPFFANLTATAFPIPREAPVMSTVFLAIKSPFLSVYDTFILSNCQAECNVAGSVAVIICDFVTDQALHT
ncbi:hypothetical protein LBYZC6_46740 [Lacrimispora brassicae]